MAPFPDNVLKLSHYLGFSIDVAPAMTTNILSDKDGQMPKNSYLPESMKGWGPEFYKRELEDIELDDTPQYDLYVDETQNEQMFSQLAEELEPMPEVAYHYIGAKILLPRGDEMAVVAQSCNANRNVMDRSYMNLMLDTRKY